MRKRLIVEFVCMSLILSVAGLGICAETAQTKAAPAKQGWMDRMKGAINNFKNRNQKAAETKAAPQAVKKAQPVKPAQPEPVRVPKTKEEMVSSIKNNVEKIDVITKMFPDLKLEKGPEGSAFCTFRGQKLEELSNEDLTKLYKTVSQIAVQYRTERMQRQLESIDQAQKTARTAEGAARATGPTVAPTVPKIPVSAGATGVAAPPKGVTSPPPSVSAAPTAPHVPTMVGPTGVAGAPTSVPRPPSSVSAPPSRPSVPPAPPTRK
ncbi:MAG: hypothetical protein WC404_02655 [Candidatus Omnitrophota bacterium]|jgi:hypothetical protein